ncbi:hypothetical protein BV898_08222 [Hypsibius exemplaris]|uniref:NmrA-like domain-containing protein n=1 Tax=Hypsibius exemplaris TaxID=2072580 RepID=A0A1W0WRD2_HYPEX|nr:hypothetical protein BV898_08222 [Hypsibius exemplaris]
MASEGKPIILVIGSTGKTGQHLIKNLEQYSKVLTVRYSSRRKEQVEKWKKEGRDAVLLDLDDPSTFALALFGVERLFLCTGYTVAMLTQSKTIVDAARRANVQHIVHLGVFTDRETTDPHFAWHDLVESYIEASGIAWTHLHPNFFMENLFAPSFEENNTILDFLGGTRVGWVAAADIASVAAVALREGPKKHGRKNYWLSSDVLTMAEAAKVLGEVLGKTFAVADKSKDADFDRHFASSPVWNERWYLEGVRICLKQIRNGELGYLAALKDDVAFVTGQPSLKLREWATQNKEALLERFK